VPLRSENRVIAKLGLRLVEETKNIGLKTLIKTCGYKRIDSFAISFGVAPRINASGRIGTPQDAIELFLTDNVLRAEQITKGLNDYNLKRQEEEKKILTEVNSKLDKMDINNISTLVVAGENWHHGVIGIVASKIAEKYFKPTILLSYEDEIAKGSGRSIPGFDLHSALLDSSEYLDKYGGHEMAVGVTLNKKNIAPFVQKLEEVSKTQELKDIKPIITIDEEITFENLNKKTISDIKLLEPFGEGNRTPVFVYKNLKIESIRSISEGKHLKLTLKDGGNTINGIAFGLGSLSNEYQIDDKIDVVGNLEINVYNNIETIQMNIKDIMKSYK
jgi:single-stranded-DNA-specific exonuclease